MKFDEAITNLSRIWPSTKNAIPSDRRSVVAGVRRPDLSDSFVPFSRSIRPTSQIGIESQLIDVQSFVATGPPSV